MSTKTIISKNEAKANAKIKTITNAANQLNAVIKQLDSISDTFKKHTQQELDNYIAFTTGYNNISAAANLLDISYVSISSKLSEIEPYRALLMKKDGKYVLGKKAEQKIRESFYDYLHPQKEAYKEKLEQVAALMNEIPSNLHQTVRRNSKGEFELSLFHLRNCPINRF